jgi:hypothetical protein
MKLERTFATVMFLALGGAIGCTAYPTLKTIPVNCDVEAAYNLSVIDAYDTVGMAGFWTAADTAGAAAVPTPAPVPYVVSKVEPIGDGARCGSTAALVIRSERNNDWGSLFGINIGAPRDESAYEGLAFWARAPGNTTKGFTVLLGDSNTSCLGEAVDGGTCSIQPSNCITYAGSDGGTGTGVTDGTGMLLPGTVTSAPEPNQCGNVYSTVRVVTGDWAFYTIPFSQFQQGALPNRVPNAALTQTGPVPGTALLTNQLLSLTFRMPKAAVMELWIDNLSFYRKATGAGGGDGGVDAPQM